MANEKMKQKEKSVGMRRSITRKISLAILITNTLAVAGIVLVIFFLLSTTVGEDARENSKLIVDQATSAIESEIQKMETIVDVLRVEFEQSFDENEFNRSSDYMERFLERKKEQMIETALIADNSNSIYYYPNVEKYGDSADMWLFDNNMNGEFEKQPVMGGYFFDENGERVYHQWYDDPINQNQAVWSDPYVSSKGNLITSRVSPVWQNGEVIGLLGMDLDLTQVAVDINAMTLFESGYIYLAKQDGTILVHKNLETGDNITNYGDYTELLNSWANEDTAFNEYVGSDGVKVVSAHKKLSNGWITSASIPENELLAVVQNVLFTIAGVAAAILIISMLVAFFVSKSISKPIKQVTAFASKIKEGDFTQEVQVKSNDETKLLSDAINEMASNIRSLIRKIQNVSSDMADSASVLASTAEETTATVEQVSSNVDEIAKGTGNTAEEAENGALIAVNIDEKFNKLMENSQGMKVNADNASIANAEGLEILNVLKEKTKVARDSNTKVEKAVTSLDERTKAITNIIEAITSIADQTNLLALNASIEAARAGEAGKGFAVVATEIRNLAEDSRQAADEIRDIVGSIQQESKDTVNVMKEVNEIAKEQNKAVEDAGGAFETIFDSMKTITNQIEMIAEELNGLNIDKNQLVAVVNNISAAAEQTAAATEEVNQSTNEQTKAVEEVARSAEQLNELSLLLREYINVFKV